MNRALQWKLIAGFVLVFLAGGITGAFVGGIQARRHFFEAPSHRDVIKQRMTARLQRELKLTPDQLNKISPIIDKSAADVDDVRTKTAQRVHEIFEQAHHDMESVLTDEQRAKLQQMPFRHRRGPGMRPPPPPPEDHTD